MHDSYLAGRRTTKGGRGRSVPTTCGTRSVPLAARTAVSREFAVLSAFRERDRR
jgi:hypothetical protein